MWIWRGASCNGESLRKLRGKLFWCPLRKTHTDLHAAENVSALLFSPLDMADVARLLQNKSVNFLELKRAADTGGIWPGVEAFLLLVYKYVASFGVNLEVPGNILESKSFSRVSVHLGKGFLRVPKLPAAGLYAKQLANAGVQRDLRAIFRLPLLPPLAISALLAYRLTGSDKGVW